MNQGSEDRRGSDVLLKFAGQEINLRNIKSLNTIATLITMLLVGCIGVFVYFHEVNAQQDKTKVAETLQKSNADIAAILRDSNAAQKEQTAAIVNAINRLERKTSEVACLNDPLLRNQSGAREYCRQRARDDR